MTKTKKTAPTKPPADSKPSAEEALLKALAEQPDATAGDLASAAGLGRSTASKTLARLEQAGEVRRSEGGRDGGRRLPDRWALASSEPAPAPDATTPEPATESAKSTPEHPEPAAEGERLKPGELDGLVLTYMQKNSTEPLGSTAIARGLGRSSGAVGNCLKRLAQTKKVRQVNDRPLRYQIAS